MRSGLKIIFIVMIMVLSIKNGCFAEDNSVERNSSNIYKYTNSLINEQSAYLLAHAHNPVDWYPWKEEIFRLAKRENKLIFVSIGYSTCHWCHVMEEESFENEEIAKILNSHYVSIKVDKEELPHIDTTYQRYYSQLNQSRNGWPLNFIMTPDKKIIHMGTYIPPNDDYGILGLKRLLPQTAARFYEKDPKLFASIEEIDEAINNPDTADTVQKEPSKAVEVFLQEAIKKYDKVYHGFEKSPKFPLASHLGLLWDIYLETNNTTYKNMVIDTLLEISKGGITDHIEGGFYRYSVYADWNIPHFEKMLYTQAELIPIYTKVYLYTKDARFKESILSVLKFADQRLRNADGLYYSAIDADSQNDKGLQQEGYYYLMRYDEAFNILNKEGIKNTDEILGYLNIEKSGNFEGIYSNPYQSDFNKPENYSDAIAVLKKVRDTKKFPFIDKKILGSWNAMMIKALLYGSFVDEKYLFDAQKSLLSFEKNLIREGNLYHQTYENKQPSIDALLEDYSFYIDALLSFYQVTFDKKYLQKAAKFAKIAEEKFYLNGIWYLDDAKEHEAAFNDRYYTSPLSRLLHSLITIANLQYDKRALQKAKRYIDEQSNTILNNSWLSPEAIRAIYRV